MGPRHEGRVQKDPQRGEGFGVLGGMQSTRKKSVRKYDCWGTIALGAAKKLLGRNLPKKEVEMKGALLGRKREQDIKKGFASAQNLERFKENSSACANFLELGKEKVWRKRSQEGSRDLKRSSTIHGIEHVRALAGGIRIRRGSNSCIAGSKTKKKGGRREKRKEPLTSCFESGE